MKDLFENYAGLPEAVSKVVDRYASKEELTYEECEIFLKEVRALGYTFEYGLDAIPFNLKPKTKVIVVVRGGLVSGACSNDEDVIVDVLDHDNWEAIEDKHDDEEAHYKALDKECESMHDVY